MARLSTSTAASSCRNPTNDSGGKNVIGELSDDTVHLGNLTDLHWPSALRSLKGGVLFRPHVGWRRGQHDFSLRILECWL
jgi:hypothetical protein